jgi:hypothetical protein
MSSSYSYGSYGSGAGMSFDSGVVGSYSSELDDDVVTFYVHRDTEEKLWDRPPEDELHQYQTWLFDSVTGEVTQQTDGVDDDDVGRSRTPSPAGSDSSESVSGDEWGGTAAFGAAPPPQTRLPQSSSMGPRPPRSDSALARPAVASMSGPAPPRVDPTPAGGARSGPAPPRGPAPPAAGYAPATAPSHGTAAGPAPQPTRGPRPPTLGGRSGPGPPRSAPPMGMEPEPEAVGGAAVHWNRSEKERRQQEQLAQMPVAADGAEATFDQLEQQHRQRRLAKLKKNARPPPMREPKMPSKSSTAADRDVLPEVVSAAAPDTDFATNILSDPTCTVSISQDTTKLVGKTLYYAIDVTSAQSGQWRVFRRFKMFAKLQDTWVKDSSVKAAAERIQQLLPSKTYLRAANDRDVHTRKIQLDSYLKHAFDDAILKAQSQEKGSAFHQFLCHQSKDEVGGGLSYRSFLRVRTGARQAQRETAEEASPVSASQLREVLLDLLLQRRVLSKLPSRTGRVDVASRAELDRMSNAQLKSRAQEEGIMEDEWTAARRFVWVDSRGEHPEMAFTHIDSRETEDDIWELVTTGERPPIRSIRLDRSTLNPEASLRDLCAFEIVAPEATVLFYAGSELAWVQWMSLLAPLLDKGLQAEYYDKLQVMGTVGQYQAVETLGAKMTVPNHTRVGESNEFADFTYGRVKPTFAEPDPHKREIMIAGMSVLADDVDSISARINSGREDGPIWSPSSQPFKADPSLSRTMTPNSVAQSLAKDVDLEFTGDMRVSASVRRRRRKSVSAVAEHEREVSDEEIIVMDCGSSFLRVGVGGESMPRLVKPMNMLDQSGGSTPGVRGGAEIDWEWQTQQWRDAFAELDIDPTEHRMVLTGTASLLTTEGKERIEEIMHEIFGVPFLRIEDASVAILVACHRQTGIVLDMGNQLEIAAIAHGYPEPRAGFVSSFGGFELTKRLRNDMSRYGIETSDMELVRKIKEDCCRARDAAYNAGARVDEEEMCPLTEEILAHPDVRESGCTALPARALWQFAEEIFKDARDERGLHEHISDAVGSCDQSLKPELYRNIVIAGGTTCLRGFETRLEEELREYVSRHVSAKAGRQCQIIIKRHRKYLAWQGVASMSEWDTFWQDDEKVTGPGFSSSDSDD